MIDITHIRSEQNKHCNLRFGITKVNDNLWLGGEEDVCEVIPNIDVWIDFRNFGQWNRKIFIPKNIMYMRMPFEDGDSVMIYKVMPIAKEIAMSCLSQNQKLLVSCHAGASRSVILVLWILSEELGYEKAWKMLKKLRPHISPDENFHDFINEEINKTNY